MSTVVVFTGPTLPAEAAAEVLEARYRPPVSQGDVTRAVRDGVEAIGIIDGYFESVPAVWHKEILFAMDRGVHVYGSASMGALRAAELAAFGMVGVGSVFEAFRDGDLEDDDEVAVIHGPLELGCPALSEAMVNIRQTLMAAEGMAVIGPATRRRLERLAKSLPYRERSYATLTEIGRDVGLPAKELEHLASWLPRGRIDRKREDALQMLRLMAENPTRVSGPKAVRYHFEHTIFWDSSLREAA